MRGEAGAEGVGGAEAEAEAEAGAEGESEAGAGAEGSVGQLTYLLPEGPRGVVGAWTLCAVGALTVHEPHELVMGRAVVGREIEEAIVQIAIRRSRDPCDILITWGPRAVSMVVTGHREARGYRVQGTGWPQGAHGCWVPSTSGTSIRRDMRLLACNVDIIPVEALKLPDDGRLTGARISIEGDDVCSALSLPRAL